VADCRMPERVLTDLCPAQYAECAPDLPRIVVWLARHGNDIPGVG